jgi:hypothetical protein
MISCAVAYPGCEWPPEPKPDPVPTVSQFAVDYHRSGGLKAELLGLQIEPGRRAILEARGETTRFRVAPKEIRSLRSGLEKANWKTIAKPASGSATCADCYQYSIEYRGLTVSFDEAIQTRRFDPAIDRLEALIDSHLPFH